MTLIKSISGIRGTIGGKPGDGLSPVDVIKYTAAFMMMLKEKVKSGKQKIVVGRDARISGEMINSLVTSTIQSMGKDVIDIGLSTTPTVEIAVVEEKADAGIIITASHNPENWNALKLLNDRGEFISEKDGEKLLYYAENQNFDFASVDELGKYTYDDSYIDKHINKIIELPLVDVAAIRKRNFTIAVDGINSTGGTVIPLLLEALGVESVVKIYCTPDGRFSHNPEPLAKNLTAISELVTQNSADVGFVVDPDVDRLAIITEEGEMFGEEYTLVAVADYVLQHKAGNTVSNLSSTQALKDVTEKAGGKYFASAVGEVNVVELMKKNAAVIGGEGNGGVIYPELHYGRDALVGIALFLTQLAKSGTTTSELRRTYPDYFISKNKIELDSGTDVNEILECVKQKYNDHLIIDIDGLKIIFDKEWVHLRKSNTEPIIRVYAESDSANRAEMLANKIISDITELNYQ
ncbi:MAG: phosphoglucosamine mutase [Bacteroidales bacterium]|nr:phosphoglucosamine mutase [Bacteroidales bacterium]